MGITDFFKGELIDVIEWTDDSRDTLSYRFPDDDKAIKNGAQLIVRESQVVQFVYLGAVRRHVRARQAHADHRQHPDPDEARVVEVRLQFAVQGRRLLRHHAALHRQQMGHVEPGDAARQRLRRRARARVRHLRLQDRPARRRSCARSPAPITTSASTSSATRCARASSACSRMRSRPRRCRCSTWRRATPSSATRCCR